MKIVTMAGSVPASSSLPRFSDLYPSLISPEKLKVVDGFSAHAAGALAGKSPPVSSIAGLVWGVTGASVPVDPTLDGGVVTGGVGGLNVGHLNLGRTSYELLGTFRRQDNGIIGMALRFNPATSDRVTFYFDGAVNAINLIASGGPLLRQVAFNPAVGESFKLRAVVTPTQLTVYNNGTLVMDTANSAHNTNTHAGIIFNGSTTSRCLEFVVGW